MSTEHNAHPSKDNGRQELAQLAGQYLTFLVSDEYFGVNILKVQEIIGVQNITRVPDTTEELKGVINLRGQVIAVIDMRVKFGMEPKDYDDESCIIIVETQEGATGFIVDKVEEVETLSAKNLEPAPRFHSQVDTRYFMAMGKAKEKVVILLDCDAILNGQKQEAAS